jgi:hypothetical protein
VLVASKNIKKGEIPVERTVLTFKLSGPLEPEHAKSVGAAIVTVVDCWALPPGPMQFRVYVVSAERTPVLCVPLTASVPDQPPEAVQAVAPVEVQVSTVLPPLGTMLGSALMVMVGAVDPAGGAALTVIVADWVALPPAPVHVNIYFVVVFRGPVD